MHNLCDVPAVSVHPYFPLLTMMTSYDPTDGRLEPTASLASEDPEPAFDQARPTS